ncbi:MAG: hypothetical protein EXR99_03345 [Gemmataceae bacterium]|nr:hypothetical protein [Gemmataceae bacterium]
MRWMWKTGLGASLSLSSLFLTGCFNWCPFCTDSETAKVQQFQPKPSYSVNQLNDKETVGEKKKTGAGAIANVDNPLDGKPFQVEGSKKVEGETVPASEINRVKYQPQDKETAPVYTIPAPTDVEKGKGEENPGLGLPSSKLTPGPKNMPEPDPVSMEKVNDPVLNLFPLAPADGPVLIPPPPGGPNQKPLPSTTVLPPAGGTPKAAPLGIPAPPSGTPYR